MGENQVEDGRQGDAANHIDERVLLEKEGGQTDENPQAPADSDGQLPMLPDSAALDCQQDCDGACHMDGGADIGGGIQRPDAPHQKSGKVGSSNRLRTKCHPVWKQEVEHQTQRYPRKQDAAQVKIMGAVPTQQNHHRPRNQAKPAQIGEDEPLAEGDDIIQPTVQKVDRSGDYLLQQKEDAEIAHEKNSAKAIG